MAANRAHHHDSAKSDATPSTSSTCRIRTARAAARTRAPDDADGIECSRGCCESCVAGAIADGVAVCCCPCAVVDLAAFVLVRVPWMVGRRCLAMARGKSKRKRIAECGGGSGGGGGGGNGGQPRRRSGGVSCNYLERWSVNDGMIEVTTSFKHGDDDEEADERVWLELCRGFGRLSFTGIQSAGKGS